MSSAPNQGSDAWNQVVTLAAGLAHEIKNPLSTISLNLQLLQEDWVQADTPRERRALKRLATLQREANRLSGLLEDFLRYAGTLKPELDTCNVNELIREVIDFVAPQVELRGIEVRSALAAGLPPIQADPKLLKQAFLNLVINAEDAMPDGGELILQTALADGQVKIDLTDTGAGIPDHQVGKIFNIYFSTKEKGSGLGLPTTRRIIELHHGTIDVESEIGKGTHLTIRLPLSVSAAEERP